MQSEPLTETKQHATISANWRDLIKVSRPRQWVKNVYVLSALVFSANITFFEDDIGKVLLATLSFCLISSSVYVLNDLADIERDRQHPRKRSRPLASGSLHPRFGVLWMVFLFCSAVTLAWVTAGTFLVLILIAYCAVNIVYSFYLKRVFLFDAATVASGFVLRAAAGAQVLNVTLSPWLFLSTILLSLFLAFGKRRSELTRLGPTADTHRSVLQDYSVAMLDQFITITVASIISVYAIYAYAAVRRHVFMLTLPFVLYGLFRYLYILHRTLDGEAPDEALVADRPTLVNVFLWAVASGLLIYNPLHLIN